MSMTSVEIPVIVPETGTCIEAEPFALQVLDDAMEPEFPAGCIIIIDPTGRATDGAFVLAQIDEEFIFRTLHCTPSGDFELHALNAGYAPLALDDGLEAVTGVITQRAGRRRRDHKHYD
jgi:DNA polymerase V